MSPLVKTNTVCYPGQSAMFISKEENGFQLNWTSFHTDSDNKQHNEWFQLDLRDDFINYLKELGTLPPTTTKALMDECKRAINFEKQAIEKTQLLEENSKELTKKNKELE